MRRSLLARNCFYLLIPLTLAGCNSVPRHSNTLIFATNTKTALDVSQDPTGGMSLTLGYKRQEGVWMPLLANKNEGGVLVPQDCTTDDCRQFVGKTGDGGPSGKGGVDTYSVLATFSGQAAGKVSKDGGEGTGALAQYFATGIAARLLAASGSSIVNTSGTTTPASAISASTVQSNKALITSENQKIDRIIFAITSKEGKLDPTKRSALVDKATKLSADAKKTLLQFKTIEELRTHIELVFVDTGQPLFDAT